MGDMGDHFNDLRQIDKERREHNLANANSDGWLKHTDYHWSRFLNGERLDYWPSRNKWQYQGRVMCGRVEDFILKRMGKR